MTSNRKQRAPQVNPIVKKASEQVTKTKRRVSKPKAKDLPRRECRDQLSLFDSPGDVK